MPWAYYRAMGTHRGRTPVARLHSMARRGRAMCIARAMWWRHSRSWTMVVVVGRRTPVVARLWTLWGRRTVIVLLSPMPGAFVGGIVPVAGFNSLVVVIAIVGRRFYALMVIIIVVVVTVTARTHAGLFWAARTAIVASGAEIAILRFAAGCRWFSAIFAMRP